MSTRTMNHGWWWWAIGGASAAVLWIISVSVAAAQSHMVVRAATQTTFHQTDIGPSDAPVRSAVFTAADREQLKVEPARWGGWGYRAPYYAYYPGPYYSAPYYSAPYYSAPYYSAPYYSAPYYTYYTPPTYYSATPSYGSYAPYYSSYAPSYSSYAPAPAVTYYRYPRRAFYGAYYW
jgi:hypothetical protein